MATVVVTGVTVLIGLAAPVATRMAEASTCVPWAGETSLQSALFANECTEVQPGTYVLGAYVVIPDGHTLVGNAAYPRTSMVLTPATSWVSNGNEGVVMGMQPPHVAQAHLAHLVLDGAGISTGGVAGANMTVDDVIVRRGRCWGVAIVGVDMEVTGSLIERNGAGPGCPSPPGAGIYAAANQVPYGEYAPSIVGNTISDNTGPGVDIDNVWNGVFSNNTVVRNTSWAGVSLLGAHWVVDGNAIDHPATNEGQPWVPACSGGPKGAHSSAILLCQATSAGGVETTYNRVTNNTVKSWYGILLIGNDQAVNTAVPRYNTIAGNIFTAGTSLQCADDYRRNGTGANSWTGCRPTYF